MSLGSSVVITGGYPGKTRVSTYQETGWALDLPYLHTGRFAHGCSFYQNQDGTKTILVSGGRTESGQASSSTEVLTEGSPHWTTVGSLPSPRSGLRGINIDNTVFITGGYNGVYLDQILEFDPNTGEWRLIDEGMLEPRFGHAVTSVPWERVQSYCSERE